MDTLRTRLQEVGLLAHGKRKGAHRKKRERRPLPGMLIHQPTISEAFDGTRYERVALL